MQKQTLIDANIILRFILNDNEELSQKAREIVLGKDCCVSYEVIAEVVYVLSGVYGIERAGISNAISIFLPNVTVSNEQVLQTALSYFAETRLDFVDCILAAHRIIEKKEILSFDKKLNNFMNRKEAERDGESPR